jgi:hypothetical protein
MREKTGTWIILLISCGLVAALVLAAGFLAYPPVDRDTMNYLVRYGRGALAAGPAVIWNVHIIYGLYLYLFSRLTPNLIAPTVFLSLFSLIAIALAGFALLKNHVPRRMALWGFLLILFLPGLHNLSLMMEDNLPYLAGIAWTAVCLDALWRKGFSWPLSLLCGFALGFAILFHTLAIVFVGCPLLLLFAAHPRREKWQAVGWTYLGFAAFVAFFLAWIPNGFSEFLSAYTGTWGIGSRADSLLNETHHEAGMLKRELDLPFRAMQAAAPDVNRLPAGPIKNSYYGLLVLTNLLYYGLIGTGIFRGFRQKKISAALIGFMGVSLVMPFAMSSFITERLDTFAFFGLSLGMIGLYGNAREPLVGWRAQLPKWLLLFFVGWTGVLYGYMTRWLYHPPYYQKIVALDRTTPIDETCENGLLFLDEESLFENADYFILIRHYPRMQHYGIEPDGRVYFIGECWGTAPNYLSPEDIRDRFFSGKATNYAIAQAQERFREHYPGDAPFKPLPF